MKSLVQKLKELKGKLYDTQKNVDYVTHLYNEEKVEKERLEAEAEGLGNLIQLQEVRVKIGQEELRKMHEKVKILEQEVQQLKDEKVKVLSGLTEVLRVLESKRDEERVMSEEESKWADVPEDYESDW